MVDELAGAARSDASKHRRAACYFVIGKIGRNLQDARCASVLFGLLAAEKDKHNIAALLERIGEIPKRAELDLDAVYALLEDGRWLIRHAAIRALDNTASPEVENWLLKHLVETEDPVDQTYCHAVLNRIGTPRSIPAIEVNLKSRNEMSRCLPNLHSAPFGCGTAFERGDSPARQQHLATSVGESRFMQVLGGATATRTCRAPGVSERCTCPCRPRPGPCTPCGAC
jgi:HEAT repeats